MDDCLDFFEITRLVCCLIVAYNFMEFQGGVAYKVLLIKKHVSDHVATNGHKRVVKEKNHEDAISAGSSTSLIHEVPTYSAIGSDFIKMTEKERSIGQTLRYSTLHRS